MKSAVCAPSIRKFRCTPWSRISALRAAITSLLLPTRYMWTRPAWSAHIGVLMNGFGFTGAWKSSASSGGYSRPERNKEFLDPFSPTNMSRRNMPEKMLGEIHEQFIEVVRQGRGNALKEAPEIFSGIMWTARKASSWDLPMRWAARICRARSYQGGTIVDYTTREGFAERFAKRLGGVTAEAVIGWESGGPCDNPPTFRYGFGNFYPYNRKIAGLLLRSGGARRHSLTVLVEIYSFSRVRLDEMQRVVSSLQVEIRQSSIFWLR